jgi:hypothetical protein
MSAASPMQCGDAYGRQAIDSRDVRIDAAENRVQCDHSGEA